MGDYDVLFEPVRIGPKTAPNRFYQVPHCNGLGHARPTSLAAMRGIKAEGGWGVVCTEEVEIHPTSDLAPYVEGRLWDDDDIAGLRLMTEAVHEHGSLAGIELTHAGLDSANHYSRMTPIGPRSEGVLGGGGFEPVQTRAMTRQDFADVRRWHRAAALRARDAGFDIVYCYAAHGLTLPMQLLSRRHNDRTDEYGGPLVNRVRFLRELIEDTKEAVGDDCAVAVRLAVDELVGEAGITHDGEAAEIVSMLAELPDLWDVNVSGWSNDSATSRFAPEGHQEPYIAFVKGLTTKPVVGVGRYTSPDSMVSAVTRGVLDLLGAARPSIADPHLPRKVREGRLEEIRECIGCNICVATDPKSLPIRCTQNPTMGEEWRRSWHPERIPVRRNDSAVMVIGAGPAGLEAARALGQRGHRVDLLDARRRLGGRVDREALLPGLAAWRRVVDWRLGRIEAMPQVSTYPESPMTAEDVLASDARHVIVATGALWRRDGRGRSLGHAVAGWDAPHVRTPDDVLDDLVAGTWSLPAGRVLVYDDDHYVMGGLLAEALAVRGHAVTLVTPAPLVSYWSQFTLEQERIELRLRQLGVRIVVRHVLHEIGADGCLAASVLDGAETAIAADVVILAADREPLHDLHDALLPALHDGRLESLRLIGDADAPNLIAQAVFAGHLAAREHGESIDRDAVPFRRERWTAPR
ncbi:MAG: FAD-dependent oxidoreductase [Candidatus Nanopelagicales bacterium]